MADINKEIKENQIILVVISKDKYPVHLTEILKGLNNNSQKISYVSFNQPYNALNSLIQKNGLNVNKFFFIDTVTSSVQNPKPLNNCIFVSAPNALTEVSVAVSKALSEQKCDAQVFDSLSALLIYDSANSITLFTHNVITKLKISGSKAVFIALKEDISNELIKDIYMFVDKVVELE